ncbi:MULTISPECIES: hypothetical protein [Providencia]|uniref:hypothetical protein n=1 Tax=Providencia TaxID=586 RepID=UPI00029BF940|nr:MULTISPECIES: hypothetical protein [Providencia]EKT64172.1 hypothetical protein OO9_14701 [Providencia alcalifaciens Dmel2]EUD05368.1 hypothetical protein HMPREF1564_0205 [Providencia alcalifaciens R90-1475]MBF0691671.1 hypothetical protein [Providencia alcalifaciens]NYS90175.1 hypothetical protein [Providencia alcalifaciens]QLQ96850.1 hypothetical protein H0910_14785 [Providencia alcalifaciens]
MNPQMSLAIQNIIDVHMLIEDVFTGRDQGESLQALLGSFDKTFKMVTIQGASMNAQQASELFSKNRGVRPSLVIEIRNIQPLFECDGNTYWIQYLEHQTLAGKENSRTSTVCIKIEDGKCHWLYLHETPILVA